MKKLLIALLFITNVQAEIIATMPNRSDGYMYFTDALCREKKSPWKVVYSTYDGGGTIWGCWFYDDGMVHVSWWNGDTSAFRAEQLTLKQRPKGNNI